MNFRRRILVSTVAVLLALCSAGAAAQSREALLEQRREQLRQKYEARFRQADADQSRGLSRAEIESGELPRRWLQHFDEIDTDASDSLSPEELWAAWEKRMEVQKRQRGPRR